MTGERRICSRRYSITSHLHRKQTLFIMNLPIPPPKPTVLFATLTICRLQTSNRFWIFFVRCSNVLSAYTTVPRLRTEGPVTFQMIDRERFSFDQVPRSCGNRSSLTCSHPRSGDPYKRSSSSRLFVSVVPRSVIAVL